MLLIFFGASCSGKSSAARLVSEQTQLDVWTGKEYVRLGNSEPEAWQNFVRLMADASKQPEISSRSILYITDDPQRLEAHRRAFEHVVTVKFIADLETLKERFRKRLQGKLPSPIASMLKRQMDSTDAAEADLQFDTTETTPQEISDRVLRNRREAATEWCGPNEENP